MIYDLTNKLHVQQLKTRLNNYTAKGKKIEVKLMRKSKSLRQNRYLHLILSWFAIETGYTLEETKQDVFKRFVCKDVFIVNKKGIYTCRSVADLSKQETTFCVEKFRNWSSAEMGIYLPSPDEQDLLEMLESQIDNKKIYL